MTEEEKKRKKHEYYEKNKEELCRKHREYHMANKEKIREKSAEWVAANPEKVRQIKARYRDSHKDQLAIKRSEYSKRPEVLAKSPQRYKKYREANREKLLEKAKSAYWKNREKILPAKAARARESNKVNPKGYEPETYLRLKELTPPGPAHGYKWSDSELSYLREQFDKKPYWQIAQELGRTWGAVNTKAARLGLLKLNHWV
jgi:hypothetical protein